MTSEKIPLPKKLQGTDGIRGRTCSAKHPAVSGLTPVEAFIKKGFLTEEFVELYSFCYVESLRKKETLEPGYEIVIGWDPRDTPGIYYQAAIRGIRKAGAKAVSVGILPTPAVPLYLLYREAKGGIMITASHNPPDQNGIKLFSKTLGLKPLPEDDEGLSSLIYQTPYQEIPSRPLKGGIEEAQDDASDIFLRFFDLPGNTWLKDKSLLKHLFLIIDPAYGCLKSIASQVFNQLGVYKAIEVCNDPLGQVNINSGVTLFEGIREINSRLQDDSGNTLEASSITQTIFEKGRKNRDNIMKGNLWVAGAVFDADGDRFYRLDYDPIRDRIIILSGDEIAYHQAKYLMNRFPAQLAGTPYVNTVESDLNSSLAAARLGYSPVIEAVGDKWLLIKSALTWLEAHQNQGGGENLKELERKGISTIAIIENLLSGFDLRWETDSSATNKEFEIINGFSIGSEASGHTITPGLLKTKSKITKPVFIGNGLKSAINTFVATESLYSRTDIARYLDLIHMPFPRGFQKSLQVYYTQKKEFYNGSSLWHKMEATIKKDRSGLWTKKMYPQEPDMLYLSLNTPHGTQEGALFIRNSGTEDKTVVTLKGTNEKAETLMFLGQTVQKFLFQRIKDQNHSYAQAESRILKTLSEKGRCFPKDLISLVPEVNWDRFVSELAKQRLIEYKDNQVCLTPLGSWYIQDISSCPKGHHEP